MKFNTLLYLIAFFFLIGNQLKGKIVEVDPAEKIFLHTNQPYYLSGDTIEFSAYAISYLTFKPSTTSEVLHISLWNSKEEIILKKKLILNNGFTSGTIEIPKNLSTGNYVILANTNWMLNFKELQYSKKAIRIINPTESKEDFKDEPFSVSFFPEGGQIISGHLNQVAFHANETTNEVSGVVVSEHSDTVSIFSEYELGYGKFSFFPNDTIDYTVIIESNDSTFKYPLEKSLNNSVSLKLIENSRDTLTVFVNIGQKFMGEKLELLIQNRGEIILGTEQSIIGNRLKFLIPKRLLGHGLNQLVVLNNDSVLSERLYFAEMSSELSCEMNLGKTVFKPNEQIVLPLFVKSISGQSKDVHASLSIRNTKFFGSSALSPITYAVNLFSEIDFIPPSSRFSELLEDKMFLDIFLTTQKIKAFGLNDSKEESSTNESFYGIETADKALISGRVKDKKTNQYFKNATIFCSVIGNSPQFYAAKTNENGYFMFEIRSFEGNAEVILKLADVDEETDDLIYELEQNLPELKEDDFSESLPVDPMQLQSYINFKRDNLIINRIYHPIQLKNTKEAQVSVNEGFFLNYTYQRDFTEYIALNNFEEMVRELIPGLVIRGKDPFPKIYLKKYDKKNDYLLDPFDQEPLRIIDGVPVFDSNQILNLNPEKVKMVNLINSQFSVNGILFDGILEITTVGGAYHKNHKSNHLQYTLEGFSSNKEDFNEQLLAGRSNKDKIPDFRSVLYWNPNLNMKTNELKEIEFQGTDDVGEFLVQLQGIDSDGNLVNYQSIIQVKE